MQEAFLKLFGKMSLVGLLRRKLRGSPMKIFKSTLVCLLVFSSISFTKATSTPISNHISDQHYKSYPQNYHQVHHQGYGYPSSYQVPVSQKQDGGSILGGSNGGGGLSGILSSLTSSFSGDSNNGDQITSSDDSGFGDASGALSVLAPAGAGLGGVALGAAKGLLNFKGVTAFGLGFAFLFFMVLGPVIAAGIAVPIVAIVYASIYIPAIGLMNTDFGELTLLMPGGLDKINGRKQDEKAAQLAKSLVDAQQCVERFSCEIARAGKGNRFGKFIQWAAEKSEAKTANKVVKRVARAAKSENGCFKYSCDPIRTIQRLFR